MANEIEKSDISDQPQPQDTLAAPAVARPRFWSRRRILTLAGSAAVGVTALLWPYITGRRGDPADGDNIGGSNRPRDPRFRPRKSPALSAPVPSLKAGLYARQPSVPASPGARARAAKPAIIHYVDATGRAPFVLNLAEKHLRPAELKELTPEARAAHVRLGRASVICELAALDLVSQKLYSDACQLLVTGINNDLAFKHPHRAAPSLRLLDLLALVAVRQGDDRYLKALQELVEKTREAVAQQVVNAPARRKRRKKGSGEQPAPVNIEQLREAVKKRVKDFEARSKKWQEMDGNWHKRIRNPEEKVVWSVTLPPDTTGGKNVVRQFEIPSA